MLPWKKCINPVKSRKKSGCITQGFHFPALCSWSALSSVPYPSGLGHRKRLLWMGYPDIKVAEIQLYGAKQATHCFTSVKSCSMLAESVRESELCITSSAKKSDNVLHADCQSLRNRDLWVSIADDNEFYSELHGQGVEGDRALNVALTWDTESHSSSSMTSLCNCALYVKNSGIFYAPGPLFFFLLRVSTLRGYDLPWRPTLIKCTSAASSKFRVMASPY